MNKTGKRWICFLALLMCLCLLLTSCNPVPQQPAGNSEAQVENLAKLCKVWGYVKYTRAFCSGRRIGTRNCSSSSRLFLKPIPTRLTVSSTSG